MIKMQSNFIQNYEKQLVESALESAVKSAVASTEKKVRQEVAHKMKKENYPPREILKITGVDITKDF